MAPAGVALGAASLALLALAAGEFYDTFSGRQISPAKYQEYERLNLVPYCAIFVRPCDPDEPRRADYSCNSLKYPARGMTMTPYRRMLPPMFSASSGHRPSQSGTPLPNARSIRTSIMSDGRVESKTYTQLVPNSAVFITADITSVHDTVNYVAVTRTCCETGESDPRCIPIRVPENDVHLRYSNVRCLNLTKAITYQDLGCAPRTLPPERINTQPPMLEMSIFYGSDELTLRKAREGTGGRLKEESANGVRYPPSGSPLCFQNQPGETRCHDTPSPAPNGLIGSNIMAIWLWRNHNNIARRLEALNPCWGDERLFIEAREVNIAMANQVWYYELMPTVIGFDYLIKNKAIFDTLGHINDYDPSLEPRVSIEYVIGTRWFHTIQEGRLKLYSREGRLLNELKAVDLNLRTGILPNNRTLEGLTQGVFRQPTAEVDHLIDPDMGERVVGSLQFASDVASSDIMKSREAGLPPYNNYRKLCGLPVPKDFDDLRGWMYQEQIDGLKQNYEDVDDIDLMAGIIAERRMRGAIVGPTLACIMTDQLVWWRRADRFWYENSEHPGAFTPEQLREIRRVTMSRLICDNADEVDKIQPFAYIVPRDDNELIDCSLLPRTTLDPWKDEQCQIDINNSILQQQQLDIKNNKQQVVDIQTIAFKNQQGIIDLNNQNQQQLNIQSGIDINNQNQQQLNVLGVVGLNNQNQQQLNIQNGIGINDQNQQQLNVQGVIGLNNQNQQQINIQNGIGLIGQNQQQLNIQNGLGINNQNQQQLYIQTGIGLNNHNQQQLNIQNGIGLNSQKQQQVNLQNGLGINNQNQQQLNIQTGQNQNQQQTNFQNGFGINNQNQQQLNAQGLVGLNNQNQQQLDIQTGIGLNKQNQQQLNVQSGVGLNSQNQQQLNIQSGIGLNSQNQQQLNVQNGIGINNQNQKQLNIQGGVGLNNQNQQQLKLQTAVDLTKQNQQFFNIQPISLINQNQLGIQNAIGLNIQGAIDLNIEKQINITNQNSTANQNQTNQNQNGLNNQNQLFTSAIPSNSYWDPNVSWRIWDKNMVTNWGPGYTQNTRWGPGVFATQSQSSTQNNNNPVTPTTNTNQVTNNQNDQTILSKPLFTPNLNWASQSVNWGNLNTPVIGWLNLASGISSTNNPTGANGSYGDNPGVGNIPTGPGVVGNSPGAKNPIGITQNGPTGSNPGVNSVSGNKPVHNGPGVDPGTSLNGNTACVNGPNGNNPGVATNGNNIQTNPTMANSITTDKDSNVNSVDITTASNIPTTTTTKTEDNMSPTNVMPLRKP